MWRAVGWRAKVAVEWTRATHWQGVTTPACSARRMAAASGQNLLMQPGKDLSIFRDVDVMAMIYQQHSSAESGKNRGICSFLPTHEVSYASPNLVEESTWSPPLILPTQTFSFPDFRCYGGWTQHLHLLTDFSTATHSVFQLIEQQPTFSCSCGFSRFSLLLPSESLPASLVMLFAGLSSQWLSQGLASSVQFH